METASTKRTRISGRIITFVGLSVLYLLFVGVSNIIRDAQINDRINAYNKCLTLALTDAERRTCFNLAYPVDDED